MIKPPLSLTFTMTLLSQTCSSFHHFGPITWRAFDIPAPFFWKQSAWVQTYSGVLLLLLKRSPVFTLLIFVLKQVPHCCVTKLCNLLTINKQKQNTRKRLVLATPSWFEIVTLLHANYLWRDIVVLLFARGNAIQFVLCVASLWPNRKGIVVRIIHLLKCVVL